MSKQEILETLSTLSEGTPGDLVPVIRQYIQSKWPEVCITPKPGEERGQLFVGLVVGHKPYKQGFYAMFDSPPLVPVIRLLLVIQVTVARNGSEIAFHRLDECPEFSTLYSKTVDRLQELGFLPVGGQMHRTGGVTLSVEERAEVFRSFKKEHPEWTQDKVAMEAQERLGESFLTGQDVRNAYRAMGWTWERRGRRNR